MRQSTLAWNRLTSNPDVRGAGAATVPLSCLAICEPAKSWSGWVTPGSVDGRAWLALADGIRPNRTVLAAIPIAAAGRNRHRTRAVLVIVDSFERLGRSAGR